MPTHVSGTIDTQWAGGTDDKIIRLFILDVRHNGQAIGCAEEHEIEPENFMHVEEAARAFDLEDGDDFSFEVTDEWANDVGII